MCRGCADRIAGALPEGPPCWLASVGNFTPPFLGSAPGALPPAGLAAGFHDEAARFLAAMSPQEGVREALALPGLTPPAEMALSIR